MNQDTRKALELLRQGDYTCVVCRDDTILTATVRGVKPLLNWLDTADLKGFCAADKVVGRAAAFLYCLLGVKEVYAHVMSRPAAQVLRDQGITVHADTFTDGIINRQGTGPCPFEAAVMDITDPAQALTTIRNKLAAMQRRHTMEIGIQVSSLKPLLLTAEQVKTAFTKMKALGSHVVQLQWIDPAVPIADIAEILRELEIRSVSVQDFYDLVTGNLNYYTGLNAATGGTWLCVSRIPDRLKSREGLDGYIRELRQLQEHLDPLGQKVCFHPVTPDYTAVPGMNAVEYLLEAMPELSICLDLYHLNRNCADMPGFIRKYAGRICMVHFKDSLDGQLVPTGQGDTNWEGVVAACLEAKVPYAFAEQETWTRDPYECLKEAMDWIQASVNH